MSRQVNASKTARRNNATRATFNTSALEKPFAEGAFRLVAKGVYIRGERKGEPCVCKWFKTGCVYKESFFEADLATSNKAVEIISHWNDSGSIDKIVQINLPEVWTFDSDCSMFPDSKILQEPFIENYQRFNSNSGWKDDSFPWAKAMQALSHFSYHSTNGQYLLCDLQGGVYKDGVVLTDPVIMSTRAGQFGPTDLGTEGMSSFFFRHTCNEFCRRSWKKPSNPRPAYPSRRGTTMDHVPTRATRQKMTYRKW